MSLSPLLAVVLRQVYLIRGSSARVMPLFAWVGITIVLWGFITRYLNTISGSGINFTVVFLGAVLLWEFLARVMLGVTTAFMEDVWSRNFLNLFASPMTITQYVGGLVATSILTSAVGLTAMLMLATLVFGLSFAAYGLMLIPLMLTLFLTGIALGIAGCAIMLRFGPAAEWFIWPLPALLSPFAGVFYPISILPQWMQVIAHLLPPAYIFDTMRAVVSGQAADGEHLLIGASLAILYTLLASWLFMRVYTYALKSGLIARYSAESIG